MRITIVAGFFLPVPAVQGGATEKIWFRFAQEFAAAGHEVLHLSRRWPGWPDREEIDGVRMLRLPGFRHTRSLAANLTLDFIWGLRVARALPPADVLICNTVSLPVYAATLRPAAGRVAAVLGRMPKGQTRCYGRVHRLIATSEAVRAKVLCENPRLAARTKVFANPIDWSLHQQPRVSSSPLTIGYVGRLHPEKGLELLLQAAAQLARDSRLPPWRLRLIGPQNVAAGGGGEAYVTSLTEQARAAGAHVSIEPPVFDVRALAQVYSEIDLFCYPSLAEKGEGLSVAPLEAMAAGAVPVVSKLDCYRDVIVPRTNGCVFDHRAPDAARQLADVLTELLSTESFRRPLAAAARETARRFDYGPIAADLLSDFARLQQQPLRS